MLANDREVIELGPERRDRYLRQMKPAIATGDGYVVTEDGASPVVNPRNSGG